VDEAEVEALRRPEDEIPDLPENQAARAFLKNAPSKGLWMPLGKEVKVMQCFRCKAFGHRTGDRECPLAISGNTVLDAERQVRIFVVSSAVVDSDSGHMFVDNQTGPRRPCAGIRSQSKTNKRREIRTREAAYDAGGGDSCGGTRAPSPEEAPQGEEA
jgi:retinitis pigmentosa 9 protein